MISISQIINNIIWLVVGSLLVFLGQKYLSRPKIRIIPKPITYSANLEDGNRRRVKWMLKCLIDNASDRDASDVEILYPQKAPPFDITKCTRIHLPKLTTAEFEISYWCVVEKIEYETANHYENSTIPIQIKNLKIILRYKNEKGTSFYTVFDNGENKYYRIKNRNIKDAFKLE